jgi:hypothetical protein
VSDKPPICCLVAKPIISVDGYWYGDVVLVADPVTLERAVEMKDQGYAVVVDPSDEEALTRWEMIQRSRGAR